MNDLARRFPFAASRQGVSPAPKPPASVAYPTKKVWPPDFGRLSIQEHLRFEKKFKRRLLLATARPRWNKAISLIQLASIGGFVGYVALAGKLEWQGWWTK